MTKEEMTPEQLSAWERRHSRFLAQKAKDDERRASLVVIITRHAGLVAWLAGHGVHGTTMAHAESADVAGKVVVGVLPPRLMAAAAAVVSIDMDIPAHLRGQELTTSDIDAMSPVATAYAVTTIHPRCQPTVRIGAERLHIARLIVDKINRSVSQG